MKITILEDDHKKNGAPPRDLFTNLNSEDFDESSTKLIASNFKKRGRKMTELNQYFCESDNKIK